MARKKPGGNPKNRPSGRVTEASTVPKPIRQAVTRYKNAGGTLTQLLAVNAMLGETEETG